MAKPSRRTNIHQVMCPMRISNICPEQDPLFNKVPRANLSLQMRLRLIETCPLSRCRPMNSLACDALDCSCTVKPRAMNFWVICSIFLPQQQDRVNGLQPKNKLRAPVYLKQLIELNWLNWTDWTELIEVIRLKFKKYEGKIFGV